MTRSDMIYDTLLTLGSGQYQGISEVHDRFLVISNACKHETRDLATPLYYNVGVT